MWTYHLWYFIIVLALSKSTFVQINLVICVKRYLTTVVFLLFTSNLHICKHRAVGGGAGGGGGVLVARGLIHLVEQ